jgi:uncharacterized protein (DUF2164 family)
VAIEISREARQRAIASLQRYFKENMEDEIGNLTADALLGFFIDEVGAVIYNAAVADVQNRLQARVLEVDAEVYEEPFQYWSKADNAKRR